MKPILEWIGVGWYILREPDKEVLIGRIKAELTDSGYQKYWVPTTHDGVKLKPRRRKADAVGAVVRNWRIQ